MMRHGSGGSGANATDAVATNRGSSTSAAVGVHPVTRSQTNA